MSERPGLDPEAAVKAAGGELPEPATVPPGGAPASAVIDTRRYRWAIGAFGLTLVIALSVYQFATRGIAQTGVMAGHRLHYFSAPLAASNLDGDANANPPCSLSRHDPRALNICLAVKRAPLVLAFFVTGSSACVSEVDVLQQLARRYATGRVTFAAVAVHGSHAGTLALVRSHHWTIPVAYDRDGAVGGQYGVVICPLLELARPGGVVAQRLIGSHWASAASLAPQVRALAR